MDYSSLISKRRERFSELEEAVGDPELFSDPKRATEILREHRKLQQTLELWETLEDEKRQLADNQELAKSDDPEFAAMAASFFCFLAFRPRGTGSESPEWFLPTLSPYSLGVMRSQTKDLIFSSPL